MDNLTLWVIAAIGLFALVDFLPRLFITQKRQKRVAASYTSTPRYLILPTVYGDISYLQNLNFLKKYSKHVAVCTSQYETAGFYKDLRKVCRANGLRYICVDLPKVNGRPLKNPYTIYRSAFISGRLGVPANTPCLLMDADTYSEQNINNLIRAFIASGYDVASLRCEASRPTNLIEKLQAFEYRLAMDARNMDPWLTSGACSIATAGVFKRIFSCHSNFFIGGDIEIGKLANIMGYKNGFLDFTFLTAVPDNFRDWFKQRIIWFSGGIRHHVTNITSFGWQHFFILFYNSLLIYLLLPLRWVEVVKWPLLLPIVVIFSWLYVWVLCLGKGWKLSYLLLPAYSFVQTMVILPLAIFKYLGLVMAHRSFGYIKHDAAVFSRPQQYFYNGLNLASAAVIVIAAFAVTIEVMAIDQIKLALLNY